jgi:hypothetical protein
MAILQVSDQQLEVIIDALSMARRQCEHLAAQAEDKPIREATRAVAQQYGDLRRQLKDGLLTALITGINIGVAQLQGPSSDAAVRTREQVPS